MVPGVLGAQLFAKLNKTSSPHFYCATVADWYNVWLNLEEFFPGEVTCWVDNMKMHYNATTHQVYNTPGVKIESPNFGSTASFEYLDTSEWSHWSSFGSSYFAELVKSLLDVGYQHGVDLVGAPFDWRIAPKQNVELFKNMTKLVESTYARNNNTKVALLAHSMGNLFIYHLLQQHPQAWKDKYIDSFASINAPWLGSVKSVKALISGDADGHDWILPRLEFREVSRTFSSLAFMLPRPDMWPKDKQTVVIESFLDEGQNYTVNDYEALFKQVGCEDCYSMWKDNWRTLGDLKPPNVTVHCIYSSGMLTSETLVYNKYFPDVSPSFMNGDGDGTVNIFSNSYCLQWGKQQSQPVYDFQLPGNSHVGVLMNKTLHSYVKSKVLANN